MDCTTKMATIKRPLTRKDIFLLVLLGLLAANIFRSYFQGFDNSAQLYASAGRRVQDGFITLSIKFLHFFISKCQQMRLSSMVMPVASSAASVLFWVVLTRSVSSMDRPL